MAEKSVITNIENRIRQLMDDHKRLSDQCAELTAQRDSLKAENRTLQERIRELDGELSRMQLTEGLAGGSRRQPSYAGGGQVHRAARKARIAKPQREGTPPLRQRLRKAAGRTGGSKKNETRTMAQQAITLKLAGKSYSLNIDSEKEEMYRLAEREVNSYLAAIKQNNFKNWTDQDYLSMAALKFAIANVDMRQSRELSDEDLKRLGHLGEEIDAYLNALKG